jgi:hypothetical protein
MRAGTPIRVRRMVAVVARASCGPLLAAAARASNRTDPGAISGPAAAANCFSTARELSLSVRSGSGLIICQTTAPVAWNSSIMWADFTKAFRLFGPISPRRARTCWHATNSSTTLTDSASRPRCSQNSTTTPQHLP